uniref:Uncharacterized protein n=2 Tax=Solanum tuberosum TaxID=4113 RepID=M1BA63_SOLTU
MKTAGLIQTIDPKNVKVNSRHYRADLHCAYHLGGIRHTTEDCINLKHKIQHLIDQKVVTLQTVAPNANSDSLPNSEGLTINMIEVEEDWCVDKSIIPTNPDNLEKIVASLSIVEKSKFVVMAPHQAFPLVPKNGQNRKKVNDVSPKPLPHLYKSFLVEGYDNDDSLREGTTDLLEEEDVVLEELIETPGTRDAEPMEQVLNWTSTPLLISRSS